MYSYLIPIFTPVAQHLRLRSYTSTTFMCICVCYTIAYLLVIVCEFWKFFSRTYLNSYFCFSVRSLVNCLKPGSVSKVNKTSMAFKCMENISSFLNVAANMGVPAQETFQTVDLWERQNLNSVVTCLQSLGRKVQCFYCFVNLVSACGRSLLPSQTSGS